MRAPFSVGFAALALSALAFPALADADEEALFQVSPAPSSDSAAYPSESSEDAIFGGADTSSTPVTGPSTPAEPAHFDPLSIGGQLYLRSSLTFSDRGSFGEQRVSLPGLLDIYLDARPEDRVRAFISGRLSYNPSLAESSALPGDLQGLWGSSVSRTSVVLDQLWLKTDIARRVFLTIGQERVKWGASRLWNPNDFLNKARLDPTALYDERTGVPLLKAHVPIGEHNLYVIALTDGVSSLDQLGVAGRFEWVMADGEYAISAIYGAGRTTAIGLDISTPLGPLDFTLEASLSDETSRKRYQGTLDLENRILPTSEPFGKWLPRISAGLSYQTKYNDEDLFIFGLEYFYNAAGTDNTSIYPWLALQGDLQPFYLGQHYLGFFASLPSPGDWNNSSFSLAALGNLSDKSFLTRLDFSQRLHSKLRLEAYAQGHFGTRGGELHFGYEVPDIAPIPNILPDGIPAFSLAAPVVALGLNLRVAF